VPHHTPDRSRARWAEATTRHDGATLGYDPTGWSYAVDRSPRVKTDGTGHVICRPHHHYSVPAFNALASVWGFGHPGTICRGLGQSVTVRSRTIKGWIDGRNRQTLLGKFPLVKKPLRVTLAVVPREVSQMTSTFGALGRGFLLFTFEFSPSWWTFDPLQAPLLPLSM
jgi:hypothetical protein